MTCARQSLPALLARIAKCALLTAVLVVANLAPVLAQAGAPDVAVETHTVLAKTIARLLRAGAIAPERPAAALGWDCLAAIALAGDAQPGAKAKVEAIASRLEAIVMRDGAGAPIGWAASIRDPRCGGKGYDAFSDGSCNPPETVYAFQSGLAIACLAAASRVLGETKYLDVAAHVLEFWTSHAQLAPVCSGCIYFATSNHANDSGRYVRNMNMFMAYGAAELGLASGDKSYSDMAARALDSDMAERKAGNRGYLGMKDPAWKARAAEAERIENHMAAMAVLSMALAGSLRSPEALAHARVLWSDWAHCANAAWRRSTCRYWAGDAASCQATLTAAHCAFRNLEPHARRHCGFLLNKVPQLTSFGLWAFLTGRAGYAIDASELRRESHP